MPNISLNADLHRVQRLVIAAQDAAFQKRLSRTLRAAMEKTGIAEQAGDNGR